MNVSDAMYAKEVNRSSDQIEAAVNRGLMSAMFEGMAAGAAVMRAGGVPTHVSARVLNYPHQRRASDWQKASESF
jgi:hypothetical protein